MDKLRRECNMLDENRLSRLDGLAPRTFRNILTHPELMTHSLIETSMLKYSKVNHRQYWNHPILNFGMLFIFRILPFSQFVKKTRQKKKYDTQTRHVLIRGCSFTFD